MERVVIIGAGECGVRAAFALREKGFAGDIALLGNEGSLPYERPPLSKGMDGTMTPIRPEVAYIEAGIDFRQGTEVARIDPALQEIDMDTGESLSYDKLLLATGARARRLSTLEGCRTLRTAANAVSIFRHITSGSTIGIIGGGFIGLELAAIARSRGADVTIFEAADRLLARAVPAPIADVVTARHQAEGVMIRTSVGVTSATATTVCLTGGKTLQFDLVIAGVGSQPNTSLAEAAGLAVGNGILVDEAFRTSDPHIFAAGDCCNFDWRGSRVRLESWKAAQDQGDFIASAMLGHAEQYAAVPWFWSDQYDLTLQVAGIFDSALPILERSADDSRRVVFQCDERGHLTAAAGIGSGQSISKDIRLLERLIQRDMPVDPTLLSDQLQNIKQLLRSM